MISFIIIGRNEGWKLTQCIESVNSAIFKNNLDGCEIIYVDSNSTDDSIERAKKFKNINIFKLVERYNPAIARNIGALYSNGDVLIFLDADMTIYSDFLKNIIVNKKLVYPLIGGIVIDVEFDSNRNIIKETAYHSSVEPYLKLITGGAFIINRFEFELVEGMDNRFIRGEDPELGIRLADESILLKSYPFPFVNHYDDKMKVNNPLTLKNLNKSVLFSNMLIYRKNIFSKHAWKRFYTHEKSFISLILSLLCVFIFKSFIFILIYVIILVLRSINNHSKSGLIEQVVYYSIRDLIVLVGFLVFHPKKVRTKDIKYERVKTDSFHK